jgi:hypothetical protein
MTTDDALQESTQDPESRWPAVLAILLAGLIYVVIPPNLSIGPRWLFIVLIAVLEIPTLATHKLGFQKANRLLGYVVSAVMTLFMLGSLTLLIMGLLGQFAEPIKPAELLRSATILWGTNVVVFSLWYWRLDAGGPHGRDALPGHTEGAFLFPQMTWDTTRGIWSPKYIDYLFLAFNTSTAFSPTDVPVLDRWAKVLTMLQSLISLTVLAVVAARAINIL